MTGNEYFDWTSTTIQNYRSATNSCSMKICSYADVPPLYDEVQAETYGSFDLPIVEKPDVKFKPKPKINKGVPPGQIVDFRPKFYFNKH